MRRALAAALMIAAATGVARAESLPGDPVEGLAIARDLCADCHYVEGRWADLAVSWGPPFVEIADNSSMTEMALRVFLRTPHVEMPDFVLTDAETADVISYILTLKNDVED